MGKDKSNKLQPITALSHTLPTKSKKKEHCVKFLVDENEFKQIQKAEQERNITMKKSKFKQKEKEKFAITVFDEPNLSSTFRLCTVNGRLKKVVKSIQSMALSINKSEDNVRI